MPQFTVLASFLVNTDTCDEAVDLIQKRIDYALFEEDRIVAGGADTPDANEARNKLQALLDAVEAIDSGMDDPKGDGSGDDARPPEGDDYNDVVALVRHYCKR